MMPTTSEAAACRDLKDLLQDEIEAIFDAEILKVTKEFKELGKRSKRKLAQSTRL